MFFEKRTSALSAYYRDYDTCVISGASSGIGSAFLDVLFALNPNLSVVNLSRTEAANPGFEKFLNIKCDFSQKNCIIDGIGELKAYLKENGGSGKLLLINNSGIGEYTEFCAADIKRICRIIEVNALAPIMMTKALCDDLICGHGAILNVCSTAAFQPTPFMATYGASKGFLLNWSISISAEMKMRECTVSALCPGPTATNFFDSAGFDHAILPDAVSVSVRNVAEYGLKLIMNKKVYGIPGFRNKILICLSRLVPLKLSGKLALRAMISARKISGK